MYFILLKSNLEGSIINKQEIDFLTLFLLLYRSLAMGINIYFQLNNNQNIFQPGDYVNGHVNIQLQKALTSIKGL